MTSGPANAGQSELRLQYQRVIELYFVVKEPIIAAERADEKQRLSITAINELRSALDHIMRAHGAEYLEQGEGGSERQAYCRRHLDKARGHLYRAGFDAYDIIGISLIREIEEQLDKVPREIIFRTIPDSGKHFAEYRKSKDLLTKAKLEKDVLDSPAVSLDGRAPEIDPEKEEEAFKSYEEAAAGLKTFLDAVILAMPRMVGDAQTEAILEILKDIPIEVVHEVVPQSPVLLARFHEIAESLREATASEERIEAISELTKIHQELDLYLPQMRMRVEQSKTKERKAFFSRILSGALIFAIGSFVTFLAAHWRWVWRATRNLFGSEGP